MDAINCVLGWSVLAASQYYWMLIVGRVMTGFFDCLVIPGGYMFISEVSERKLKGSFLNSTAVASGLGIAFGYLFGSILPWRFSCFVAMIANLSGILCLLFCYESPVYLLMKKQPAHDVLHWYRQLFMETKDDNIEVDKELKEIEDEVSSYGDGFMNSAKKLLEVCYI